MARASILKKPANEFTKPSKWEIAEDKRIIYQNEHFIALCLRQSVSV